MSKNYSSKKKMLCIAALALFMISSCNFSKGVKKDLNTGLTASYNGAALEDIYLADSSENKLSSNKIKLGDKVMVLAKGVENFTIEDGKVFPGCHILVTDKNNKELLNLPDAFANLDKGMAAEDAKNMKGILYTGEPMAIGESYHLKVRFFDKKNTATEILANVDITMKE